MPEVQTQIHRTPSLRPLLSSTLLLLLSALHCHASASPVSDLTRRSNPLNINYKPAPPPEEGPPLSANALRDPSNLPWQLGVIAGSYGICLALVAILIVALSKNRRLALRNGADDADFQTTTDFQPEAKAVPEFILGPPPASPRSIPRSPVRNFSYPSPLQTDFPVGQFDRFQSPGAYIAPSPQSSVKLPGVDASVDQGIVANDRAMAQSQLEEMYKFVMEQEEAKKQGVILQGTPALSSQSRPSTTSDRSTVTLKKERVKPAGLDLSKDKHSEEKTQSRTSSIFSALRSPRKKNSGVKGMSISSPLMTPASATFPRPEAQEMNTIPPRQYQPAAPPPVPTDQVPFGLYRQSHRLSNSNASYQAQVAPATPNDSPESTMSIDERIGNQLPVSHSRNHSAAHHDMDPVSAASEHSQTPLVGLPSSPKPTVTRFPSLPTSPKPGATFQRKEAPSAVRTGGALPFRAYEPAMASPQTNTMTIKETTFERSYPLSPMTGRTPGTAMAVPYSPYQPFSPCVPMTPSLVTKADRKRMRKLEPKTPTLEMVRGSEDVW